MYVPRMKITHSFLAPQNFLYESKIRQNLNIFLTLRTPSNPGMIRMHDTDGPVVKGLHHLDHLCIVKCGNLKINLLQQS